MKKSARTVVYLPEEAIAGLSVAANIMEARSRSRRLQNRNKRPKMTSDLTRYPKIFRGLYWAVRVSSESIKKSATDEIIRNRNTLVETYDIIDQDRRRTSRFVKQNRLPEYFIDHFEAYRRKNGGVILVVSIHNAIGMPVPEGYAEYGFIPYEQLYHIGAQSYIAVFDSLDELRQANRQLLARINKTRS